MLFPTEEEYMEWYTKAGFKDVKITRIGPKWYRGVRRHGLIMGCSVTGVKPQVRGAGQQRRMSSRSHGDVQMKGEGVGGGWVEGDCWPMGMGVLCGDAILGGQCCIHLGSLNSGWELRHYDRLGLHALMRAWFTVIAVMISSMSQAAAAFRLLACIAIQLCAPAVPESTHQPSARPQPS
jgi:hypothetical protein